MISCRIVTVQKNVTVAFVSQLQQPDQLANRLGEVLKRLTAKERGRSC
jgi:hypothetical protein